MLSLVGSTLLINNTQQENLQYVKRKWPVHEQQMRCPLQPNKYLRQEQLEGTIVLPHICPLRSLLYLCQGT